jgi:thiol-disulfide isomerase/thioredoxin
MSKSQRGTARPARPNRSVAPTQSGLAGWRAQHPLLFNLLPVALVLLIIVTLVVIKATGGSASPAASTLAPGVTPAKTATSTGTSELPAGVLAAVTSVSASTLATVDDPSALTAPTRVSGNQAALTASDGKPEIVYIGAEYCPFCAAERWALVEALSRFGTFSGLSATHSSSTDVYPDTATFSFYGSTYTSPYLDFNPVEEETNQPAGNSYATLQTPTAAENSLLTTFDAAPYTSNPGSIPFLDIGNKYVVIGASFSPEILQGLSMSAIARDLDNPSSVVATAIDGTANQITASICAITGNQPASVCNSPTIAAIAQKLGS